MIGTPTQRAFIRNGGGNADAHIGAGGGLPLGTDARRSMWAAMYGRSQRHTLSALFTPVRRVFI